MPRAARTHVRPWKRKKRAPCMVELHPPDRPPRRGLTRTGKDRTMTGRSGAASATTPQGQESAPCCRRIRRISRLANRDSKGWKGCSGWRKVRRQRRRELPSGAAGLAVRLPAMADRLPGRNPVYSHGRVASRPHRPILSWQRRAPSPLASTAIGSKALVDLLTWRGEIKSARTVGEQGRTVGS